MEYPDGTTDHNTVPADCWKPTG
nr:hypothetical protein [Staphylococcus pseudintermedius]